MAYPFTPAGVTSKTADLYLLNNTDLLTQAKQISADVFSWLNSNFTLTPKQQGYISGAPAHVKFYWGSVLAAIILQRGPIIMETVPANYGPPRRTKQIILEFKGVGEFFPPINGTGEITGASTLHVFYKLVD